ncbi:phage/plasmid primase, P4 family [Pseudarthrobacter scleromae]|uniref:phage/plasmid primase, P4 family n=1 Tax=Pseudarthrobacter scleromae TaxID=158897 RepID=UPI00362786B3
MTLSDLLTKLDDVEATPDGYLVHCPAHNDSKQSLRLTVSDSGKVLMRCRAGCETKKVVKALGLTMKDLATMTAGSVDLDKVATSKDVAASPADVAALAVKLDEWAAALSTEAAEEALAYAFTRFGVTEADAARLGLGFAGRAVYDEDRNLISGLPGGPRLVVPFRDKDGVPRGYQARSLAADATVRWLGPKSPDGASWAKVGFFPGSAGFDEVLVTEGPGDALTSAVALGFDTIGIRGAGLAANPAVIDEVAAMIGDREAVIAGDGDPAGRRFAATLAEALVGREIRVKVLDVPDGLDLSDWRDRDPHKFYAEAIRAIAEAQVVKSRTAALLVWDEERYSLTDLGGARYLRDYVESLGSGVRYTEEMGFFLLEEGVWRKDEQQTIRTHAQGVADLVRNLAREASTAVSGQEDEGVSQKEKKRAARLNRYAAHVQTSRGIDSMIRELQAVQGVPARVSDFDKHPDLLACRNGVVDLRTGELMPHDPALLLTRRMEIDFDPNAKAPRWEAFLKEVFPAHPALPDYMRRLVGYGITGHTTEQCFAVLWGTGANGKSVLTDTLTEVFRELTVTTPFSTFEDRGSGGIPNDIAALKGGRLVMAAEGEQGKPMSEAILKRVTGRDLISARFMRKEFFEFRPTFLLMLATNFKPSFKGQDEGLWRRVKLIPWERYFKPEERDHRLGEKLLAEAPGIFAWAVRGAREWYAGGLQDPDIIKSSTKEYRETSDALAGFLPGQFVFDEAAGRVDGKLLFDAYLAWADEENLPQREVWTRRTFFGALEERGLTKRKTNKGVAFDGIRRARQTDNVPDHDVPEDVPLPGRAGEGFLALSSDDKTKTELPALSGADLDDVL